jgi:hypothetical protein
MRGLQVLAGVTGLVLLAAAAHMNIEAIGGNGPQAILMMANAVGVGVGALCIGAAWSFLGRRGLAAGLFLALMAGELFGFLSTAERMIVSREEAQAPLREDQEKHDEAVERVNKAEAAVAALAAPPVPSQRLKDALNRTETADAAVIEKSAERNCAKNCRELLQAQADAANREVREARTEMMQARQTAIETAENELNAAREHLKKHPKPPSATPLADRVGVPAWIIDLATSAVGSIAFNGLGCGLIAFGGGAFLSRRPQDGEPVPEALQMATSSSVAPMIERAEAAALEPPARPVLTGNVVAIQRRAKPISAPVPAVEDAEEIDADPVITFLKERVPPAKGEEADWAIIYDEFQREQSERGTEGVYLAPRQFGAVLDYICKHAGIRTRKRDGRVYCIDRKVLA